MDLDLLRRIRTNERQSGRAAVKPSGISTGSFNATLVGSGTACTFTYTSQLVEWSLIGNRLFYSGRITITVITVAPVGNMTIDGWPYAGVADATMLIAGIGEIEWRTTLSTAHTQLVGQFANGSSVLTPIKCGSGLANAALVAADIALVAGSLDFRLGGNYRVF